MSPAPVSAERLKHLLDNPEHINPRYELSAIITLALEALALRTPSDGEVACGAVGYFQEHPEGSWRQVPDQWADLPNTRPLYTRPQGMEVTDEMASDVASRLFERRWGEGTGLTRSALTAEVKAALTDALTTERK